MYRVREVFLAVRFFRQSEVVAVRSVIEMLGDERFWGALAFAWTVTPIGFILVGIVFESRLVPLWRDQARGFMPGDIALGVVFAVGYYLTPQVDLKDWWRSVEFALVVLVVSIATFYLMRKKFDGPNYTDDALKTPTKRYHDYVLFGGYTWVLIYLCVPAILTSTSWGVGNLGVKLVAMTALGAWVGTVALDVANPRIPSPRAHAYSYYPIWRSLPRKLRR